MLLMRCHFQIGPRISMRCGTFIERKPFCHFLACYAVYSILQGKVSYSENIKQNYVFLIKRCQHGKYNFDHNLLSACLVSYRLMIKIPQGQ